MRCKTLVCTMIFTLLTYLSMTLVIACNTPYLELLQHSLHYRNFSSIVHIFVEIYQMLPVHSGLISDVPT